MFADTKRAHGILFSMINSVSKLTYVTARQEVVWLKNIVRGAFSSVNSTSPSVYCTDQKL